MGYANKIYGEIHYSCSRMNYYSRHIEYFFLNLYRSY